MECENAGKRGKLFDKCHKKYGDMKDENFALYRIHPGWYGLYDNRCDDIVEWHSTLKEAKAAFAKAVSGRDKRKEWLHAKEKEGETM